jgi:hypothetical protein
MGTDQHFICPSIETIPDMVTEIHRLDVEFYGNTRSAAVLRCVAAACWREARPAKVNGIAATLGFGVGTVHSHLRMLAVDERRDSTGATEPLVKRVDGGYRLTRVGEDSIRRWSREVRRRMYLLSAATTEVS